MASSALLHVSVSVRSKKEGLCIARKLVETQCIACAHIIGPLTSVFRWDGQVKTATEYLLLCKTTPKNAKKSVKIIEELHSYSCPCIELGTSSIANPLALQWLHESVL